MYSVISKPLFRIPQKTVFRNSLDLIIYYLLLWFSLIDCLTGLFLQIGLSSIGVPYKLLLMVLMLFSMKSEKKVILSIYFLSLFSVCAFVYFFQAYTNFSTSLSMILKIMMYPFVFFYLNDTYKNQNNGSFYLERICFYNFITIFINQILGIAGLGFSTYNDGGFGIKGFYFDGNAMAVVCFCLFVFYFSIKKNNFYSFIIFLCSVLLGTKTSILAIMLYYFLISFYRAKLKTKVKLLLFFVIFIGGFVYSILFTDIFSYHIEKFKRMYELFNGRIIDVLLSGRSIDLKNHTKFYNENFSIKQFLFGYGYREGVKIIELDFFDTLYSYGFLFCFFILILYIYPLYSNRKNKEIFVFDLLILLITFTSGHVWYNTSTALFLVINNIYYGVRNEYDILHN